VAADGRPQDQGRRHRRAADPDPEPATATLLERYHAAMRAELVGLLDELEPKDPAPTLELGGVKPAPVRLSIAERTKRWDLATKLARELATAIDAPRAPGSAGAGATVGGPRSRRAPDFGPD